MGLKAANDLWGSQVVNLALKEPYAPISADLLAQLKSFDNASELAQWALRLPWPEFCSVVWVVSGKAADAEMEG